MKIRNKLSILILPAVFLIVSCNKDEDKQPENPATPITPAVNYTTEQNKANMESSGVEMVNNMRDMKGTDAIKVSTHLVNLMGNFSAVAKKTGAIKVLFSLSNYSKNGDLNSVYSDLRSVSSDPSSPQEAFDSIKGTYTWNGSEWTKQAGNDLVLLFPSSDNSTSNDASFTVTYLGYNGTTPFENYKGDLPYKISATIKNSNATLVAYNFESTYDEKGLPSTMNTSLDVASYKMAVTFNHNNSNLGFNYSFKKGSEVYLDLGGDATGNFSYTNLESIAKENTKIEEIEDLTKVANKLNVHFQAMRYIIKGDLNIQGLSDGIIAAGGSNNINEDKAVEVINKNYALKVYDTKNNNAEVAGTEFYVETNTNTYTTQEFDSTSNSYQNVTKTETSKDLNMRLKFPDGSAADMETFFGKGFEKLQDEVEKFATELENEFKK